MKTIDHNLLKLVCGANSQNFFGSSESFVGPQEEFAKPSRSSGINSWLQPEYPSCKIPEETSSEPITYSPIIP